MKTFKKLFSVAAIVALLGTLVPMYAFGANYNEEMQSAYAYAHAKGITTMTSIDNADMFGGLTRIAMAKMIANYAINVLGLEPDTSKACTFTDVSAALDKQYDNGVTLACQLGLMGQNITAFRPNDPVIRAEFGTTLSRALNANDADKLAEMNAADPYYKEHLNYLKNAGIMTNISNPSMTEVRGYVMLMMMRADDNYSEASEGCSVSEILACFGEDDSAACLAACGEAGEEEEPTDPEEVKAGTLNVTMKSEEGGDIVNASTSLPVATYTLKAVDEDIDITSIVVEQAGYGKNATLSGAALFINGARVSKVKDLQLDKEVTLNLSNAYTVKAGKSVDIELRVWVADRTLSATDQFSIKLVDVNSSAEKVKLPSNVKSNVFKLVGTDSAKVTIDKTSKLDAPKVGTKQADLFEIKVKGASAQDVTFNAITLLASDKDLAEYLENVKLALDNDTLAKGTFNGKYLTFVLDEAYTIEKGKNATFTVKADVNGGAGKSNYQFTVESIMDVYATATSYDAPAWVVVDNQPTTFDISAGRVTIERENPKTTTYTRNRSNVYLGSFTIYNNEGSDLTMKDFTLAIEGAGAAHIDTVKVRYNSTSAGLVELTNLKGDDEKSLDSKLTVYVYADIKDEDVNTDPFTMSLANVNIEENESNKAVEDISYPASWLTMKGTASDLDISNVTLNARTFSKGEADIEAISFKIQTNEVAGIKIKKFIFTGTNAAEAATAKATVATANDVTLTAVTAGAAANGTVITFTGDGSKKVSELVPATVTATVGDTLVPTDGQVVTATLAGGRDANNVTSNTVRSAVLVAGDDEYAATITPNTIKVSNPITLDPETTTTFTLKVSLASNPELVNGFNYQLVEIEAEDTTSDRYDMSLTGATMAGKNIIGRTIKVAQKGNVVADPSANAEYNKYNKSILAGTDAIVGEVSLYAEHENANVNQITVVFDTDLRDAVNDIELVYGNKTVNNPTTSDGKTYTFNNAKLTITEDEAPLYVKLITKTINSDGGAVVKAAKLTTITMPDVVGETNGTAITVSNISYASAKEFDIVPVTLTVDKSAFTAGTTSVDVPVTVTRGSNKSGSAVSKATLETIVFGVTANKSGLDADKPLTVEINGTIVDCAAVAAGKSTCTIPADTIILSEGTTTMTVRALHGEASNPSYTVTLDKITYSANTTTAIDNRMNATVKVLEK